MKIYEVNGRKVWLDPKDAPADAIPVGKAKPAPANKAKKAPANKSRKAGSNK